MGILDEDVARVRETTDLVAIASEHLALKRVGRRYVGLCPFHAEKTPSFTINQELGLFKCFGCDKGGDAITFVREVEHLDFVEAVERLAAKAGITLRYDSAVVSRDRQRRDRLVAAVTKAIEYYHRLLLEDESGGAARSHLRKRGFDGEAARRFQLGWAPDAWDDLSKHLQKEGIARDDITGAGLAFVNKANRLQDQFRGRLLFPIYDSRGETVGFGGRALTDDGPKYKNSPETPLYHKSRLLYGLNWAKAEIVARGEVIICEGYTDVMAFALAGLPNAVATCGTALADEHVQILKNLARKVTLAYDADAAGQGAAERWYGWEQKFEIQVQVADLPAGRDPAEVWHDDPAALIKAAEAAKPFMQFRIDRVLADADTITPEGRARAAELVVAVLREHPSELVREGYIQSVANLGFDHSWFKDAIARRGPAPRPSPNDESRPAPVHIDRRELDVLRWTIHDPQLVHDWLEAPLFSDPIARAAFEVLEQAPTLQAALDDAEGPVRELLSRIAVEEPQLDEERDVVRARLVVNMAEPAAQRLLQSMLENNDERAGDVIRLRDEVAHNREMGEWEAAREAAMQLVTWLVVPA